jgi:hypothetical protein
MREIPGNHLRIRSRVILSFHLFEPPPALLDNANVVHVNERFQISRQVKQFIVFALSSNGRTRTRLP